MVISVRICCRSLLEVHITDIGRYALACNASSVLFFVDPMTSLWKYSSNEFNDIVGRMAEVKITIWYLVRSYELLFPEKRASSHAWNNIME